jgi:hypothetical protein
MNLLNLFMSILREPEVRQTDLALCIGLAIMKSVGRTEGVDLDQRPAGWSAGQFANRCGCAQRGASESSGMREKD